MAAMTLTVRVLNDEDADAARLLGYEAFGFPTNPPVGSASVGQPGRTWFGAFDGDLLVARMIDREYDSYFGGAAIPTSGIAGVTVAAEHRGQGALGPLLAQTLQFAKARGAAISTLFPTAPRIYRKFGYELVADFVTVELSTDALAAVQPAVATRTRRAGVEDFDTIRSVYDSWAVEQNGPLSRRGVSFTATAEDFMSSFTGVTVAVNEEDAVCGFASWTRGQGYGEHGTLEVADLLSTSADGYRALLRAVGGFASVTPQTKIDTSGDDLARLFLASRHWPVVNSAPYMLKLLDVPAAISGRHYAAGFAAQLGFQVEGDFLAEINGGYLLSVSSGQGECVPAERQQRTFTPQGLALMYAGSQSSANLRAAGHLRGGTVAEDASWDALFGGRQQHIRDYF
jgi:predicted acetyltransferase